jgi:hypothetical protein
LQKYFIVDLDIKDNAENGENLNYNKVALQQLRNYKKVQKEIEDDMQVIEEAAKTNKTNWFKRTEWLLFLKSRNLAYLGYTARLPDRNEAKL